MTMYKKYLFTFLVLSCYELFSQRFDFKFLFDGVQREFILVRPSGTIPSGGFPIVMMLHGTTGDGEKFFSISGWKELGEKEKFITIYPSSLAYCYVGDLGFNVTNTKWNNGDLQSVKCPNKIQDFKDDVKFLRKVIDTVQKIANINPKKIFVAGFSNGSVMANKLAVEASDIFAAAASNAGQLHPLDSGKPLKYIPVWQTIGVADDYIVEQIGKPLPFNDSLTAFVPKMSSVIRGAENISDTNSLAKSEYLFTYTFNKPKQKGQTNYFLYSYIKDLTHLFPNGVNHPVAASVLYWDFFKQVTSIATPLYSLGNPREPLQLFPNPSSDLVHITIPAYWKSDPLDFKIINTFGAVVLYKKIKPGNPASVSKNEIGTGMYTVVLQNKNDRRMNKLIFQ